MNPKILVDNFLGIKIPFGIQEKIEKRPKIKNLLKYFEKRKYIDEYAQAYFVNKVLDELKTIKKYNEIYGKGPKIIPFEGDTLIEDYEKIKEKYKKDYCPDLFFNKFSKSNKLNYMVLRMTIDTKLGIKDTTYKF